MVKKILYALSIAFLVWLILSLAFYLGLFKTWQDKLADSLFTQNKSSPEIVIIAIDDPSINQIGRWPWTRVVHAELLEKLAEAKPKAVGVDISFLEPENEEVDSRLSTALGLHNAIIAAEVVDEKLLIPIEKFIKTAKYGVVNTEADQDGVTRMSKLIGPGDSPSFAGQISGITNTTLIPNEGGNLRINFTGGVKNYKYYSYIDVLEGKIEVNNFQDKIVLIGASAPDLHDTQMVPTSTGTPMPGVEIQANIIETLLTQNYLVPEPFYMTLITMILLSGLVALALSYLGLLAGIVFIVGVLVSYLLYSVLSFDAGIIRNLVFTPFAIIITAIGDLVYKYFSENKQKRFIKKALAKYVSEDVMNEILKDPDKLKLGGERRELTVLFTDIAGFTTISEKLDPEILTNLLNKYLTVMSNLVFENRGVVDKYIGDAIMTFWGAPLPNLNHASDACNTALQMREAINEIINDWEKAGIKDFDFRVGINTGEMVVGNMGSETRFDYSLIGDNVNLGSRLEGINKIYGTKILISGNTQKAIGEKFIYRKIDIVAVKGKKRDMEIYELLGQGPASQKEQEFLEQFEIARAKYEKGQFKESLKLFKQISKNYQDSVAKAYIERLEELIINPPKKWDGVYRAKSK